MKIPQRLGRARAVALSALTVAAATLASSGVAATAIAPAAHAQSCNLIPLGPVAHVQGGRGDTFFGHLGDAYIGYAPCGITTPNQPQVYAEFDIAPGLWSSGRTIYGVSTVTHSGQNWSNSFQPTHAKSMVSPFISIYTAPQNDRVYNGVLSVGVSGLTCAVTLSGWNFGGFVPPGGKISYTANGGWCGSV